MKTQFVFATLVLIFLLILTACELPAPAAPQSTELSPESVFTSAAQTAEAQRLQRAGQTTSPQVEEMIATVAATTPPPTIPPTTPAASPTLLIQSPTATQTAIGATAGADRAEYVEDVTIPDGTNFAPGKSFVKTWRLRNIGTTTWSSAFSLVFIDGDLMGAKPSISIPKEVAPYENIEISVDMIAPSQPGDYRGYWKLKNANGQIFGFGANADEAIWVEIKVVASLALEEDSTPTPVGNGTISGLSLMVNNPVVSAGCPHTFSFTAPFTLTMAATVSYSLEAGDNQGASIRVPPPVTHNLLAGNHAAVFEMTFAKDIIGWARLRISEPIQMLSNQVNFTLTCS